jgi:sugar phosphate isomerase/epimerase
VSNIFAGHTNSYHGFTFEQALQGISAAGFKCAELTAVKGWTEHLSADMSDAELDEAKALMAKYGIDGISLSGHCDLFDEQRLEDFRKNIELASKLGCRYIVTSTGEAHFGEEEGMNDDILVEHIKSLLPDLEKYDLTMVLELHGVYCKGEDMARITRAVGSPYVGVNYDTANVLYFGDTSCIDDIKTCIDQVKYVHLKDKIGGKEHWHFPGTGNGELPLKEFMEYMDANNYTGPYSIAIEYTEDYCMRDKDQPGDIDVANKEMSDAWKYLHSLGRV